MKTTFLKVLTTMLFIIHQTNIKKPGFLHTLAFIIYRAVTLVLFKHLPKVRPITVRLTHTELSGVTALDFMVEHLDESPLPAGVGDKLRQRFKDVIEEPTTRGFRVKILL